MNVRALAGKLASMGLPVFRLRRGSKNHFIDSDWATGGATAKLAEVWDMFSGEPVNIGVLATGFVVLDVDNHGRVDGFEALKGLSLPVTFSVRTGSGGLHLYFSTTERFGQHDLAPGINVRATNGYLVGPGSEVAGKLYVIENDAPIAPLPAWLAERLRTAAAKGPSAGKIVGDLDTPTALSAAESYLQNVAPEAIQGQGGDAITFKVAARVLDFGVSPEMALELMDTHYNPRCDPPWEIEDLQAKIDNAAQYRQSEIGRDNPAAGFEPIEYPQHLDPFASRVWKYNDTAETVAAIPPRPWIAYEYLMRENVTVLGAPGATSKSTWSLQLALAVALGDGAFIGVDIRESCEVLVINNEDPLDEMRRRLGAVCLKFGLDFEKARERIHIVSGHGSKVRLARRGSRNGQIVEGELVPFLTKYVLDNKIGVGIFDPLTSLHESAENDNTEMQRVMDVATALAANTKIAMLLLHHTAKPSVASSEAYAGNVNSIRGASAIKDASRISLTAFTMSEKDAKLYGVKNETRHRYVRFDDAKANMTLATPEPTWFYKATVRDGLQEPIGVLEPVNLKPIDPKKKDDGSDEATKAARELIPAVKEHGELRLKRAAELAGLSGKRLIEIFEGKDVHAPGGVMVFERDHGCKEGGAFKFVPHT